MAVPHQTHNYTELRQQIHDDLRIQHPQWVEPNGESPMCDSYEGCLTEQLDTFTRKGIQRQERRFSKSMTAITVRFPDESVELDNVEERRVLTDLEVIYEGGLLHGKTADFLTRDLERVVVGLHLPNWNFLETYKRTTCVDIRSQRTIFRYASALISKTNNSSWWERLLAVLRIHKLKAIEI